MEDIGVSNNPTADAREIRRIISRRELEENDPLMIETADMKDSLVETERLRFTETVFNAEEFLRNVEDDYGKGSIASVRRFLARWSPLANVRSRVYTLGSVRRRLAFMSSWDNNGDIEARENQIGQARSGLQAARNAYRAKGQRNIG